MVQKYILQVFSFITRWLGYHLKFWVWHLRYVKLLYIQNGDYQIQFLNFFHRFSIFFYLQGIVWRFGDWHCCASLWERLFEIFQYCRTEDLFVNILDFFYRPFVFSTYHLGHILVVNAVDSYLQKGSYQSYLDNISTAIKILPGLVLNHNQDRILRGLF